MQWTALAVTYKYNPTTTRARLEVLPGNLDGEIFRRQAGQELLRSHRAQVQLSSVRLRYLTRPTRRFQGGSNGGRGIGRGGVLDGR